MQSIYHLMIMGLTLFQRITSIWLMDSNSKLLFHSRTGGKVTKQP